MDVPLPQGDHQVDRGGVDPLVAFGGLGRAGGLARRWRLSCLPPDRLSAGLRVRHGCLPFWLMSALTLRKRSQPVSTGHPAASGSSSASLAMSPAQCPGQCPADLMWHTPGAPEEKVRGCVRGGPFQLASGKCDESSQDHRRIEARLPDPAGSRAGLIRERSRRSGVLRSALGVHGRSAWLRPQNWICMPFSESTVSCAVAEPPLCPDPLTLAVK
jgi:hypothetical protein